MSGFVLLKWFSAVASSVVSLLGYRENAEAALARILALGATSSTKATRLDLEWKTIRSQCLERMATAHSYCSRTIIQNFSAGELANRHYIAMEWRVDFSAPDRWHVTQEAVDQKLGVLRDEWISIGSQNFQNVGMWVQTGDDLKIKMNRALSIDGLVQIIKKRSSISVELFRNNRASYILASYAWVSEPPSFNDFFSVHEADGEKGNLKIWIDVARKYVMKGVLSLSDGAVETHRVTQVFSCFDDEISVERPPWLNATPNPSGGHRIVDTRVPMMPHHR